MSDLMFKIKYQLDDIEYEIVNLMKYYEFLRREYDKKNFLLFSRKKDPRTNAFFNSFKKLLLLSKKKQDILPDVKLFIKAQFEILKLSNPDIEVFPQFIFGKSSWSRYRLYINQLYIDGKENEPTVLNENHIIEEIKRSAEIIETINLNKTGKPGNNLYHLLKEEDNWIFIQNKMISPYYLSISKSFDSLDKRKIPLKLRRELPKNISIYREEILNSSLILSEIRDLLKEDLFNL